MADALRGRQLRLEPAVTGRPAGHGGDDGVTWPELSWK
jgi:hypothetical protein